MSAPAIDAPVVTEFSRSSPPLAKTHTLHRDGVRIRNDIYTSAVWEVARALVAPHYHRGASRPLAELSPALQEQWLDQARDVTGAVVNELIKQGVIPSKD